MDEQERREALSVELDALWAQRKAQMMEATDKAPGTNIVGGSEWQVRAAFDRLREECFRALVGSRVAEVDRAAKAAFSPSAPPGGAGGTPGPTR